MKNLTNARSVEAEKELTHCLEEMISHYESLPIKERKYITISTIKRFILMNHERYKEKNAEVIKRVLARDLVIKYHERNNLTAKYKRIQN